MSTDADTTTPDDTLARIDAEAAQDRADRANPSTAALVEARDQAAAGGRFRLADSQDRLLDQVRGATREQLDEARAWVGDCMWKEDPDELDELTDAQVVRGVDRHYDGGWRGLVRNAGLDDRERE